VAVVKLRPGQVRLIFPRTRPALINPLTQEAEVPPGTYDPHVQADIAQFAQARGDTFTYGLDYADQGASVDNVPGMPGAPGAPGGAPALPAPTMPGAVIEPDRFHRTARTPWALTTANQLVLPAAAPSTPRVFLMMLNKTASAGIVYIDFDNSASALSAPIELQAGGVAFLDQFVPQGDVYAVAASTAVLVVTFANGP
jgi:hypothetical protein